MFVVAGAICLSRSEDLYVPHLVAQICLIDIVKATLVLGARHVRFLALPIANRLLKDTIVHNALRFPGVAFACEAWGEKNTKWCEGESGARKHKVEQVRRKYTRKRINFCTHDPVMAPNLIHFHTFCT